MNDTVVSALFGFGGSVVGALAALGGTWLSLQHTRGETRAQRKEERREKQRDDLKQAYYEWFAQARDAIDDGIKPGGFTPAKLSSTIVLATRIRLLEDNVEARSRLVELLWPFHRYNISVGADLKKYEGRKLLPMAEAMTKVRDDLNEFEEWLLREKFGLGEK